MLKIVCKTHAAKNYVLFALFSILQGADFKNNQTTKQVNNSIWTNRKQVKFCFYLPIGPNKNCLIVLLFDFKIRSQETRLYEAQLWLAAMGPTP